MSGSADRNPADLALEARLEAAYDRARSEGFPMFPGGDGAAATPVNCYPFHLDLTALRRDWAMTPRRAMLVAGVAELARRAEALGLQALGLMIGGSFADRSIGSPGDLDGLFYYSGQPEGGIECLAALQRTAKSELAIDVRFTPIDASPLLLIRTTVFFSLLYAAPKTSRQISRPPLFLDLSRESLSPALAVQADAGNAAG